MGKKELENRALSVVEKMLRYGVSKEEKWWPPYCTTILHQPKRPEFKKEK